MDLRNLQYDVVMMRTKGTELYNKLLKTELEIYKKKIVRKYLINLNNNIIHG